MSGPTAALGPTVDGATDLIVLLTERLDSSEAVFVTAVGRVVVVRVGLERPPYWDIPNSHLPIRSSAGQPPPPLRWTRYRRCEAAMEEGHAPAVFYQSEGSLSDLNPNSAGPPRFIS